MRDHDVCRVRAVLLCSCHCRWAAGQGVRLCREVTPGTNACPAGHTSTLRPASPAMLHGLSPEYPKHKKLCPREQKAHAHQHL